MSAAEVRREDQVLINEFGRLNAHARELREERALLQKRLEEVDDATTELAMGDGDDVCIPRRAAAPATRHQRAIGCVCAAVVSAARGHQVEPSAGSFDCSLLADARRAACASGHLVRSWA